LVGGLLIVARGAGLLGRSGRLCATPPRPSPAVFGYHEVFHLLVIAGVAAQFVAISLFALPTG
jgi:predicted membrane channel-forming protein YqfA (hemolysin III family)